MQARFLCSRDFLALYADEKKLLTQNDGKWGIYVCGCAIVANLIPRWGSLRGFMVGMFMEIHFFRHNYK
jgi:hypothetical protein